MSKALDILHEFLSNASEKNEHIIFVEADVYNKIKEEINAQISDGGVQYRLKPEKLNPLNIFSFLWLGKTFHIGAIELNLEFLTTSKPYTDEEERE